MVRITYEVLHGGEASAPRRHGDQEVVQFDLPGQVAQLLHGEELGRRGEAGRGRRRARGGVGVGGGARGTSTVVVGVGCRHFDRDFFRNEKNSDCWRG